MRYALRSCCLGILTLTGFASLTFAGTTRIEENNPSITYSGTWYSNGASPNSAGRAVLTNEKSARISLTFTGSGVTWVGVADSYSGIAQVYLDGTLNTVDTYSPGTKYQMPLFAAHGLASGPHTISIEVLHVRDANTSGSWVWLDGFDIENGAVVAGGLSATTGRVEQNDPVLSYNGTWFLNTNPAQSGGTAVLATDRGSRVTINFTGTGIRWIAYRDAWSGIANIYLDGSSKGTIDTFVPVDLSQSTGYEIGGLAPQSHTLTIEVTGTRNAKSAGSWVWVDAFDVTGK